MKILLDFHTASECDEVLLALLSTSWSVCSCVYMSVFQFVSYFTLVEILPLFLFIYSIYLFYIIMGPNFVEYNVYPVESVPC